MIDLCISDVFNVNLVKCFCPDGNELHSSYLLCFQIPGHEFPVNSNDYLCLILHLTDN